MSASDEKPLDPEAAHLVAKVRRLMLIASLTTFVAIAAVIGVIGYRIFRDEGRAERSADAGAVLPAGAKVLSSAIGEGRIALTVEVNGATELLTFDLKTLKPLSRMKLAPTP